MTAGIGLLKSTQPSVFADHGTLWVNSANMHPMFTDDAGNTTDLLVNSVVDAEGFMRNGEIAPSVASNNLTLALKNLAGNDPSAGSPVVVTIGGVTRSIAAALSTVRNAGTNYANLNNVTPGLTNELFAYLCWNTALGTPAVDLIWSRVPNAHLYSDLSSTATNERYGAAGGGDTTGGTPPNSTNILVNIGRFAATLSAGNNWSVPAYTASNLIQVPTYESNWLDYVPSTIGGYSANPTNTVYRYKVLYDTVFWAMREGTNGTHDGTTGSPTYSAPFTAKTITNHQWMGPAVLIDNAIAVALGYAVIGSALSAVIVNKSANVGWTNNAAARVQNANIVYEIA